ncbi:Uncharacterized protein APZ42_020819 [Daphnia magna]|uniref:Uncharacterized protein n=1 Tax=Daphnia magna TaxID=35525 RepID=A0A164XFE2_9CRUS|nr:Uncharacterized protein APZ42_020819 [Daphnia magna]
MFSTCALICSFPDAKWQSGRKRRQPARAAGTYPQATRFRRKFLRLPASQLTDGLQGEDASARITLYYLLWIQCVTFTVYIYPL